MNFRFLKYSCYIFLIQKMQSKIATKLYSLTILQAYMMIDEYVILLIKTIDIFSRFNCA